MVGACLVCEHFLYSKLGIRRGLEKGIQYYIRDESSFSTSSKIQYGALSVGFVGGQKQNRTSLQRFRSAR